MERLVGPSRLGLGIASSTRLPGGLALPSPPPHGLLGGRPRGGEPGSGTRPSLMGTSAPPRACGVTSGE